MIDQADEIAELKETLRRLLMDWAEDDCEMGNECDCSWARARKQIEA